MIRRHRKADPVTETVRVEVLRRDGRCFLSRLDPDHQCRDMWGRPHASTDVWALSLEHVHDGYGMMGRRAPSDARHLVALCHSANVAVPSKADRAAMRAYLAAVNERGVAS